MNASRLARAGRKPVGVVRSVEAGRAGGSGIPSDASPGSEGEGGSAVEPVFLALLLVDFRLLPPLFEPPLDVGVFAVGGEVIEERARAQQIEKQAALRSGGEGKRIPRFQFTGEPHEMEVQLGGAPGVVVPDPDVESGAGFAGLGVGRADAPEVDPGEVEGP